MLCLTVLKREILLLGDLHKAQVFADVGEE